VSDWFATVDVDHAAVWEVARTLLDVYTLWNAPDRDSTTTLLDKAQCNYVVSKSVRR
jgi:hypothetical protein